MRFFDANMSLLSDGAIMDVKQFAQMRGLQAAYDDTGRDIARVPGLADQAIEAGALRRVQFEATPELVEQLDIMCNLLGCTRREFLERATLEAIHRGQEAFCASYREATGRDFGTKGGDQC